VIRLCIRHQTRAILRFWERVSAPNPYEGKEVKKEGGVTPLHSKVSSTNEDRAKKEASMRIPTLLLALSMIAAARAHCQDNDATRRPDLDAVLRVLIDEKQVIRLQFDLPGKANQSFDSSEVRCALLDHEGIQVDGGVSPRAFAPQTISLPKTERSVTVDAAFEIDWKKLKPRWEYYLVVSLRNLTALVKFKDPRPIFALKQATPVQPKSNTTPQASIERPIRPWDYDGKRILGHIGQKVVLWDATAGKVLRTLEGHKERLFAVRFSPDGVHAATSSWMGSGPMNHYDSKDTRVLLWDLTTGEQKAAFKDQVFGEFSSDGKRIVTFRARPNIEDWFDATVWNAFQGNQLAYARLDDSSEPRSDTLHFSHDQTGVAHIKGGCYPYSINSSVGILYDASEGSEIGRTAWHHGGRRYTSDGMLTSIDPRRIVVSDVKTGRTVRSVPHEIQGFHYASWSHDGKRVALLPSGAGKIQIWDWESRKATVGAACHPHFDVAVIVSPNNECLAIESGQNREDDPEVRLFEMKTGKEIGRLKLAEWGHMIGFSPDSKTILVGGSEFVIYNAENGGRIRSLKLLDDVSSNDWGH
jgi:WD40 repeat protein